MRENSKYSDKDIIDLLIHSARLNNPTVNTAARQPDSPTSMHPNTFFYHLSKLNENEIKSTFERITEELLRFAEPIRGKRVDIAIDTHDWLFYGDRNAEGVVGTQHKRGTNYAYKFITVCVVEPSFRFTLAVAPIKDYSDKHEVLRYVLERALSLVNVRTAYLDSWFFDVYSVRILKELGIDFVIQGRKTTRISRVLSENEGKDIIVVKDYEMVRKREGPVLKEKVNLFIVPHRYKENEHTYFVTNLHVDECNAEYLAELFRKRWGIETSYRVKAGVRLKTCTKKYNVRYFMFLFSAILYNLWVLFNLVFGVLKFRRVFVEPLITIFNFITVVLLDSGQPG